MKKTFRCPKCNHNHVLYVSIVPDKGGSEMTRPANISQVAVKAGLLGGTRMEEVGSLSAMVCRQCGFAEFYVADPSSIPIDNKFVHEFVGT